MHDVAEHDTEEEWEGDDCRDSWVELLVVWGTVGINHILEGPDEVVCLKRCWFCQVNTVSVQLFKVKTFEVFLGSKLIQFDVEFEGSRTPCKSSCNIGT